MGICTKHKHFFQSGNDSLKTPFLIVFGYNNCSMSNPNDFNTHTTSKWPWWVGDTRKTYKFYFELKILLKNLHCLSFLAITIAVCQIEMILTLIHPQNQYVGMGICAKHTNFILSWRYCSKTFIISRFGYNNCCVSNPKELKTHTSSKWAWWEGDMYQTQNFFQSGYHFLKHHFWSFMDKTIAVCQIKWF